MPGIHIPFSQWQLPAVGELKSYCSLFIVHPRLNPVTNFQAQGVKELSRNCHRGTVAGFNNLLGHLVVIIIQNAPIIKFTGVCKPKHFYQQLDRSVKL